jgi:hypothetical protein
MTSSGSLIRSTTILAGGRFRSVHRACAFFTHGRILFQVIDEKTIQNDNSLLQTQTDK